MYGSIFSFFTAISIPLSPFPLSLAYYHGASVFLSHTMGGIILMVIFPLLFFLPGGGDSGSGKQPGKSLQHKEFPTLLPSAQITLQRSGKEIICANRDMGGRGI